MPNVRIRQSEIDSLARKLDEVSDVLTSEERTVLLAVFKLASASLAGASRGGGGGETESGRVAMTPISSVTSMPKLSSGFKGAFQPILQNFGGINPAGIDIDVHIGW